MQDFVLKFGAKVKGVLGPAIEPYGRAVRFDQSAHHSIECLSSYRNLGLKELITKPTSEKEGPQPPTGK
jgi:hypothetical protein